MNCIADRVELVQALQLAQQMVSRLTTEEGVARENMEVQLYLDQSGHCADLLYVVVARDDGKESWQREVGLGLAYGEDDDLSDKTIASMVASCLASHRRWITFADCRIVPALEVVEEWEGDAAAERIAANRWED